MFNCWYFSSRILIRRSSIERNSSVISSGCPNVCIPWNMLSSELTSASKRSIRYGRWSFRTNHFKICKLHLSQMTQSTRRSSHLFPCLVSNFPTNNSFKKLQIFHNNVVHNPWLASRPNDVLLSVFYLFPVMFMIFRFWLHKTYIYRFFSRKNNKSVKNSLRLIRLKLCLGVSAKCIQYNVLHRSTIPEILGQCFGCVKWTLVL